MWHRHVSSLCNTPVVTRCNDLHKLSGTDATPICNLISRSWLLLATVTKVNLIISYDYPVLRCTKHISSEDYIIAEKLRLSTGCFYTNKPSSLAFSSAMVQLDLLAMLTWAGYFSQKNNAISMRGCDIIQKTMYTKMHASIYVHVYMYMYQVCMHCEELQRDTSHQAPLLIQAQGIRRSPCQWWVDMEVAEFTACMACLSQKIAGQQRPKRTANKQTAANNKNNTNKSNSSNGNSDNNPAPSTTSTTVTITSTATSTSTANNNS